MLNWNLCILPYYEALAQSYSGIIIEKGINYLYFEHKISTSYIFFFNSGHD